MADPVFARLQSLNGPDGAFPNAGLLAAPDGSFFGTALGGGTTSRDLSKGGVAFRVAPTLAGGWTWTILHRFGLGGGDGSSPHSRLIADRQGALYGTTYVGGSRNQGTVFRLTPPAAGQTEWQETVLYNFTGGRDGSRPIAGLVLDRSGALYGATMEGGADEQGVVYRLSPPPVAGGTWTETVLHSFAGLDGSAPRGNLIARTVGGVWTLFGTTVYGGASGWGTVFSLASPPDATTAWTHTILYSFAGGADGASPLGGVIADRSMTLFGTASGGGTVSPDTGLSGGVVFRLTAPAVGSSTWTQSVLYRFKGGTDGRFPIGGLIERSDGRLLGTTAGLGRLACTSTCGTVFMLTSHGGEGKPGPWTMKVLHSFAGADGDVPSAELVAAPDASGGMSVYGVTERGGAKSIGTVFRQSQ